MIYAFKRRRIFQACGALALFTFASCFVLFSVFIVPADQAGFKIAGLFIAASFFAIFVLVLGEVFASGPILTVGPDGLSYPPAFRETVPWSEVSAVKTMRAWRREDGRYSSSGGGVILVVSNIGRYKKGFVGALAATERSMTGGTQLSAAQGSDAEIISAIKAYWPGEVTAVSPPNTIGPI